MKLVAPVSRHDEVEMLAAAGADELYCGVVPREWVDRFGTFGVNRRLFSNLKDLETLARVIDTAHELGRSVSLTLNAQHYAEEMTGALVDLAGRHAELGGDAVIVSDPVVVQEVARQVREVRVHVSSLASCHNTETARFCKELGARRIILPRHVTLAEIREMSSAVPEIELEVFGLNEGCVYEEGACHSIHLPVRLGGAICEGGYEVQHVREDGCDLTPGETEAFVVNERAYRDWVEHRFGCRLSLTELPFGPCGLCALPFLAGCGVVAVKVVGRGAPTPRKVKSTALVAAIRDEVGRRSDADVKRLARAVRKRSNLCDDGFMCYYPDGR
ncbi:MAG: peptidase U32 [Planctomycetes bacterium]|nr:peptidase U32 [Planctomycetota bacterium]